MSAEATVFDRRQRLRRVVERLLFASGLIGLIGLDQDIIRWSAVANWLVKLYRAVAGSAQDVLLSCFHLSLSDLAVDILMLTGIVLAAANAHSLRRYGSLAFGFAMRLFVLEQIRQIFSAHYFAGMGRRELRAIGLASAHTAVLFSIAVFLAMPLPLLHGGGRLLFNGYVLFGFVLLSNLDEKVPMDEPDRFRSPAFRRLALASVVFLPSALLRYLSFIIYCGIFAIVTAWRWHLLLAAAFGGLMTLNEIYFRFVYEWPDGRPHCAIYSIRPLCAEAL